MTFKIMLTVVFAVGIGSVINSYDKVRQPAGPIAAILALILDGVLIYGVWNWLP